MKPYMNTKNLTMKIKMIITLIVTINCFTINAQSNRMKTSSAIALASHHDKENALGAGIFKAFKSGNVNEWIALYPTNDEYKGVLQVGLAAKVKGLTQEKIEEMIEHRKREAKEVYEEEFKSYQKQADSLKINWTDAVFEKFTFEAVYPEEVKLKYLNGEIWFRCRGNHFVIEDIEAVEIKAGYRLQSIKGIRQVDDGE